MTTFPSCPTHEQAKRAAEFMFKAEWALAEIANGHGSWDRTTGYLQDALAELGFDLRPINPPAPATAEALFDDAAYSHSRGGM